MTVFQCACRFRSINKHLKQHHICGQLYRSIIYRVERVNSLLEAAKWMLHFHLFHLLKHLIVYQTLLAVRMKTQAHLSNTLTKSVCSQKNQRAQDPHTVKSWPNLLWILKALNVLTSCVSTAALLMVNSRGKKAQQVRHVSSTAALDSYHHLFISGLRQQSDEIEIERKHPP